MPRSLALLAGLTLAACAATPAPAAPPPTSTPTSMSTPTATAAATASEQPAPVTIRVWTKSNDFSGHGFSATGPSYRRDDRGGWVTAPCSVSHVADPQARAGNAGPQCGAWTPAPTTIWPVLDRISGRGTDVECRNEVSLCTELGLASQPTP